MNTIKKPVILWEQLQINIEKVYQILDTYPNVTYRMITEKSNFMLMVKISLLMNVDAIAQ